MHYYENITRTEWWQGGVITDLAFVSMLTLERDHGDRLAA
jgi:hypothetical protein